ncbi:Capsid-associated protein VP80 [Frankliniella fusca]|uniref:Capsid-associated protein VP80 n=1 Tax=Frankliniella fusca TaxID=407009 RepID=A0AAE1HN14_9NEOP|nr:Capsid-associated protein VP80 [Frankliniella fusca]
MDPACDYTVKSTHTGDPMSFYTKRGCAIAFEEEMKSLKWNYCHNCKETVVTHGDKCQHHQHCWRFSSINNMDPMDVPPELSELTFVEEQLIAKVHPMLVVFKVKGHQYGYRGNVISFSQDVHSVVKQLPPKICDLDSVIYVKSKSTNGNCNEFRVRRERVRKALIWLKSNNKYYSNIDIHEENLAELPIEGNVSNQLQNIEIEDSQLIESADCAGSTDCNIQESFFPYLF